MSDWTFWMTCLLTTVILLVPVVAWRFFKRGMTTNFKFYYIPNINLILFSDVHPTLTDKVRYLQKRAKLKPKQDFRPFSGRRSRQNFTKFYNQLRDILIFANFSHRRSIRSGYAFSHQEGFGRLITSGKIMKRQPPTNAFQVIHTQLTLKIF